MIAEYLFEMALSRQTFLGCENSSVLIHDVHNKNRLKEIFILNNF